MNKESKTKETETANVGMEAVLKEFIELNKKLLSENEKLRQDAEKKKLILKSELDMHIGLNERDRKFIINTALEEKFKDAKYTLISAHIVEETNRKIVISYKVLLGGVDTVHSDDIVIENARQWMASHKIFEKSDREYMDEIASVI